MIKKSIDMLVELIIGVCREWSWGNVLKNSNAAPFLQDIHSAQFIHVDLSCWETRVERRARAQSITTTSVPRKCSRLPDKCTSTKPNHPNGMHRTAWAYIRDQFLRNIRKCSLRYAKEKYLNSLNKQHLTAGSISLDSKCWDLWSASLWDKSQTVFSSS